MNKKEKKVIDPIGLTNFGYFIISLIIILIIILIKVII